MEDEDDDKGNKEDHAEESNLFGNEEGQITLNEDTQQKINQKVPQV